MCGGVCEAVVVSAADGGLRVLLEPDGGGDAGCPGCAMRGLCASAGGKRRRIEAILDLPPGRVPEPGETIRVFYQPPALAAWALVMFLPPLTGLFLGGFAAGAWMAGNDGAFLAGTLAGFATGLAASFAINKALPPAGSRIRLAEPLDGGEA